MESILDFVMESTLKFVALEKILKKSWSTEICVRPTSKFSVDHAPLSIVRHVGLNVDLSSMNFLLGL